MNEPESFKILLVEDNPGDALLIKETLKESYYNDVTLYVAENLKETIKYSREDIQLLLVDLGLPDSEGIETIHFIRKYFPDSAVVVLSGLNDENIAIETLREGAQNYINKNEIEGKLLEKTIRFSLERHNILQKLKASDRKLVQSKYLLEKAQEIAHVGSWVADLINDHAEWSDESQRIFGLSPGEFDQKPATFFSMVHEEDLAQLHETINKSVSEHKHFELTHRIKRKDGKIRWVNSHAEIVFDEEGIPQTFIGSIQDITEMKVSEEKLKQSELNLRIIFENTTSGFLLLDKNFNIVSFNKQISHYSINAFGFEMKVNDNFIDMVHPKRREPFRVLLKSILNGESRQQEVNYLNTDGTIEWYHSTSSCVLNETGEPVGICLTVDNITERKLAELRLGQQNIELVKTNSELDRFVYSVSHDLRSPLTSILGLLHFLETETNEPHTLEYAGMIHKSIDRLDVFIKNILSYSQNKRTDLDLVKITLKDAVDEIVSSLKNMPDAEGIEFEVDISDTKPFYTDLQRLNIVIENLISNAIKYHKKNVDGRYIKISGKSDENALNLKVEDNGVGIAPVHHTKIFDMFYRLPGKAVGSGIGLYIVKEIIEKLQGKISVTSEEGIGTSFDITIKNLMP